ncbi:MAG: TonB-dependent receptor plug domain-containing protein [Chlorobiaceae bacterium]|nr:TonB-dependent receptor plug domain-containing protein [Chlorobiaceae bacterium]
MKHLHRFSIKPLAFLLLSAVVPLSAFCQDAISPETVITGTSEKADKSMVSKRVKTSDTASLLKDVPGVTLATGGGVSSLPIIHGLGDDRLTISVDGMLLTSACANHMNPPLSYIAPSNVSSIVVKSGVSPVSYGGDNIGGTILVASDQPVFAKPGEDVKTSGSASTYYRSINQSTGAAFSGAVANSNLSFGVTGSIDHAKDYKDGHGNTITSTYYESRNLGATLALKGDTSLLTLKAGHQSIPDQGFVNQWMDMVDNNASYFNLGYKDSFSWGKLDAKAFWENTYHKMDSGQDKLAIPAVQTGMTYMPMETRGIDLGYSLKTEIPFAEKNILRLGNEFHRFTLNDSWPPVAGSMMMSPNTFVNINDGRRDRYSVFAEWESKVSKELTTVIGVRDELVQMDTGKVQGYNTSMMYAADAKAFNEQDHAHNDNNLDITALARFEPTLNATYEIGYARKTQSPNLYERYAWSSFFMSAGMINWYGDGNAYVGNFNLRPEVANTLSLTTDWHDSACKNWELKVTPYYTYVNDYIDVNVLTLKSTGNTLQFANHDARIYGLDVSGKVGVWEDGGYGRGQLSGTLGYVNGRNLDTGNSLYHMMPLNGLLTLEQKISGWTNAVELQLVSGKTEVDTIRKEPTTPGFALLNLRTAYQWKNLRLDFGITNLFDRFYYLPLGGINYDQNLADKRLTPFESVAGQGRSFNVGLTQTF